MKSKLKKIRAEIKALSVGELTEEESTRLETLMREETTVAVQVDAAKIAAKADAEEKEELEKADQERIDTAVGKAKKEWEAEAASSRRLPFGAQAPYQAQFANTWKYDGLSVGEIALVIDTLRGAKEPVSPDAFKALSLRIADMKDDFDGADTQLGTNYIKGAFKAGTGIEPTPDAVKTAVKGATDPMYTGDSGQGAEWIGTAYSRELWKEIRSNNQIVSLFPSIVIPDGFASTTFPVEGSDPTWYTVAEATASEGTLKVPQATITASQLATANKNITVAKLGARVLYTGEMREDSLVRFVPQLREQLAVSGAEIMEHILIDGDTETAGTTNINDIAGTAGGSESFMLLNGLRKLALITNTANSRSGGVLSEDDYLDTMFLMGTAGLAGADVAKCGFIVDPNIYKQSLKLSAVKTKDVWSNATLEGGVLTKLWGYNLYASWNMQRGATARKSNSDGKVDIDTQGNNDKGAILGVRFDQWKLAFKRRMTMEVTRIANADSWEIVALARFGFGYRTSEACSISYNLTV